MRILVLSDSHRDKISLMMAVKLHREADVVVFLGDGEEVFNVKKCRLCYRLKRCIRLGVTVMFIRACRAKRRLLAAENRVYPSRSHKRGKARHRGAFVRRKENAPT